MRTPLSLSAHAHACCSIAADAFLSSSHKVSSRLDARGAEDNGARREKANGKTIVIYRSLGAKALLIDERIRSRWHSQLRLPQFSSPIHVRMGRSKSVEDAVDETLESAGDDAAAPRGKHQKE